MIQEAVRQISVAAYVGPTTRRQHGRGIGEVESKLASDPPITFDDVLTRSLRKADMQGRTKAVGLDIGSGSGQLFANLLEVPQAAPQTVRYLDTHQDMKLKLIGLTDSPTVEDHLQESPLALTEEVDESQIHAKNYFYTLTREQTLAQFLQHTRGNELDFILSTNSLRFLPLPVFSEVLETGVRHLRPGGRFFSYHYAGNVSGLTGGHNEGFHTVAPPGTETYRFIQVVNSHIETETPNAYPVLYRNALKRRDPKEYSRLIEKGIEFYQRLGELTDADIQSARGESEGSVDLLAELTLKPAFERYEQKRRLADLAQKRALVESLGGVDVTWTFPEQEIGGGFILKKR